MSIITEHIQKAESAEDQKVFAFLYETFSDYYFDYCHYTDAAAFCSEAQSIRNVLAEKTESVADMLQLAIVERKMGKICIKTGKTAEAELWFHAAQEKLEKLIRMADGLKEVKWELSAVYRELGVLYSEQGESGALRIWFDTAFQTIKGTVIENELKRADFRLSNNPSCFYEIPKRTRSFEDLKRDCLNHIPEEELDCQRISARSRSYYNQWESFLFRNVMGDICAAEKKTAEAVHWYEIAEETARTLYEDCGSGSCDADLPAYYVRIGEKDLAIGLFDEALKWFHKAARINEQWNCFYDSRAIYARMAHLFTLDHQYDKAKDYYKRALAQTKRSKMLGVHYEIEYLERLGDLSALTGENYAAKSEYELALSAAKDFLQEKTIISDSWLATLAALYYKLGSNDCELKERRIQHLLHSLRISETNYDKSKDPVYQMLIYHALKTLTLLL